MPVVDLPPLARRVCAGAGAALWICALWRLAGSDAGGSLESALVTGGWMLSVLPVHVTPAPRRRSAASPDHRPASPGRLNGLAGE